MILTEHRGMESRELRRLSPQVRTFERTGGVKRSSPKRRKRVWLKSERAMGPDGVSRCRCVREACALFTLGDWTMVLGNARALKDMAAN